MKRLNFKFKKNKASINNKNQKTIAIAGNPNVGKSTVFNALTGMHQHTGNWPGKTVGNAIGFLNSSKYSFKFIDIPGTYSLYPQSFEEDIADDFLCFEKPDAVLVVCDASCLEKNLNLVFQIMECQSNVLVCVNLLDEAKSKGVNVDIDMLSKLLGVPVIGIVAHKKSHIKKLITFLENNIENSHSIFPFNELIEGEIAKISNLFENANIGYLNKRWVALKIIEGEKRTLEKLSKYINLDLATLNSIHENEKMFFEINHFNIEEIRYLIIEEISKKTKEIFSLCVNIEKNNNINRDVKIDKFINGKYTAIPIMLICVAIIFWITIVGANYISTYLSTFMYKIEELLLLFLTKINLPEKIIDFLVLGGFRVMSWVVSVMLPPMAIFFPFFSILEDSGYLARIAYNLDKPFYNCNACGKQALTMCMGFGCNAVGVTGARIIDSPRERLLAILTNNFMPCNGRFPMLITFITIFFVGTSAVSGGNILSAFALSGIIFLSVIITFLTTNLLSKTILKGVPSSYILELPSYRKPMFKSIIVRSIFDRTLFVLGRAVSIAIPAGFIIWILNNIYIYDISLLNHLSLFLEPLGRILGLNGVILLAFILGTPANEIVIPLIVMIYTNGLAITEIGDYNTLFSIFTANGWTIKTAICIIILTVFHWPCATTLLTIKKETSSIKWTIISAIIPTFIGVVLCMLTNIFFELFISL